MSRSIIKTSKAPAPVGPYSQAVSCGNILYVSGQIPLDPESGELVGNSFAEQCHRVLLNLKIILEAGGSGLERVLKVTIYMKNLAQFGELNEIYSEYFDVSKNQNNFLPKTICLLHLNIYFNSFIAGINFFCDIILECVEDFVGFNFEYID